MTDIPPQALAEKTLHLIESAAGHTAFTADWVGKALALSPRIVGNDPGSFIIEGKLGPDWAYRVYALRDEAEDHADADADADADGTSSEQLTIDIKPPAAPSSQPCPLVMSTLVQGLQSMGFKAQRRQNRFGSPRWWSFWSNGVSMDVYGGPNDDSSDDLACVSGIYIYLAG